MTLKRVMAGLFAFVLMFSLSAAPAFADHDDNYRDPRKINTQRVVKNALVGAGIGAAVGAIASSEGRRTNGAIKGAVIGGVGGAGYGYLRERQRVRDVEEYYGYYQPTRYNQPVNYNPYYYNQPYYY